MNFGAFAGGLSRGYSQGLEDSRNLTKMRREQKELEEQEAIKNEIARLQQQNVSTQGLTRPKTFNSLADALDYQGEVLKIKLNHGQDVTSDLITNKRLIDTINKEGFREAIGLFHGGQFQEGLEVLNSTGKLKGFKIVGEPEKIEYDINGRKEFGYHFKIIDSNGEEKDVDTAPNMFSLMSFEQQHEDAVNAHKERIEGERWDKTYAIDKTYKEGSLAAKKEQNAITRERNKYAKSGLGGGKWVQDEDGQWILLKPGDITQGAEKMPERTKLMIINLESRRKDAVTALSDAYDDDAKVKYQKTIDDIDKRIDGLLNPTGQSAELSALGSSHGGVGMVESGTTQGGFDKKAFDENLAKIKKSKKPQVSMAPGHGRSQASDGLGKPGGVMRSVGRALAGPGGPQSDSMGLRTVAKTASGAAFMATPAMVNAVKGIPESTKKVLLQRMAIEKWTVDQLVNAVKEIQAGYREGAQR